MPKKRLLHKELLVNLKELYQKLENFKQDEESLTNQFVTTIREYEKFANDKLLDK